MKFSGFFFSAEDRSADADRYDFLFRVAEYMDRHDFWALWTPERHFQEFGGCFPSPAVLSAAIAARTQRLRIRAGSVVAPHHHPVRMAEEWALVDQISKGRAGVCFATGWHRRDFVFFPDLFERRREVTESYIEEVQELWAGRARDYRASTGTVRVNTYPRPLQASIPVWLVSSRSSEVWTTAGARGLNVLSLLNDWNGIAENIERYRHARKQAGHAPAAGTVTIALHTFVGADNASVRNLVEEPLKAYLRSFLKAKNDDKSLASSQTPMTDEESAIILAASFNDLFESRSLLGDLDKCSRTIERLRSIGVDEIAALIDFGVELETVYAALDGLTNLKARFADHSGAKAIAPKQDIHSTFRRYYAQRSSGQRAAKLSAD